jgi:hypothetical protein
MSTEWDHRELCPDGACNGVIGPDGTCKVCGKVAPNWGNERMRGLQPEPEDADEDETPDDPEDEDDEDLEDEPAGGDEEWSNRKLCDDGACVGVIGEDGKCTVCGKQSAA